MVLGCCSCLFSFCCFSFLTSSTETNDGHPSMSIYCTRQRTFLKTQYMFCRRVGFDDVQDETDRDGHNQEKANPSNQKETFFLLYLIRSLRRERERETCNKKRKAYKRYTGLFSFVQWVKRIMKRNWKGGKHEETLSHPLRILLPPHLSLSRKSKCIRITEKEEEEDEVCNEGNKITHSPSGLSQISRLCSFFMKRIGIEREQESQEERRRADNSIFDVELIRLLLLLVLNTHWVNTVSFHHLYPASFFSLPSL